MKKIFLKVKTEEQLRCVKKQGMGEALICPPALFQAAAFWEKELYVELPAVLREKRAEQVAGAVRRILSLAEDGSSFSGFLVQNIDEIGLLGALGYQGRILAGELLYLYNAKSLEFLRSFFPETVCLAPAELTLTELRLLEKQMGQPLICKIYGHQLLMTTAQCLVKDHSGCVFGTRPERLRFSNQKKDAFYASSDCALCCGQIYNGVPTSMLDKWEELPGDACLLEFTIENESQTGQVLRSLASAFAGQKTAPGGITRGHYYKGID